MRSRTQRLQLPKSAKKMSYQRTTNDLQRSCVTQVETCSIIFNSGCRRGYSGRPWFSFVNFTDDPKMPTMKTGGVGEKENPETTDPKGIKSEAAADRGKDMALSNSAQKRSLDHCSKRSKDTTTSCMCIDLKTSNKQNANHCGYMSYLVMMFSLVNPKPELLLSQLDIINICVIFPIQLPQRVAHWTTATWWRLRRNMLIKLFRREQQRRTRAKTESPRLSSRPYIYLQVKSRLNKVKFVWGIRNKHSGTGHRLQVSSFSTARRLISCIRHYYPVQPCVSRQQAVCLCNMVWECLGGFSSALPVHCRGGSGRTVVLQNPGF